MKATGLRTFLSDSGRVLRIVGRIASTAVLSFSCLAALRASMIAQDQRRPMQPLSPQIVKPVVTKPVELRKDLHCDDKHERVELMKCLRDRVRTMIEQNEPNADLYENALKFARQQLLDEIPREDTFAESCYFIAIAAANGFGNRRTCVEARQKYKNVGLILDGIVDLKQRMIMGGLMDEAEDLFCDGECSHFENTNYICDKTFRMFEHLARSNRVHQLPAGALKNGS